MNELYNKYIKNNIILKFIIFSGFCFLFYTIITKIFIFFGVNSISIYLYMSWIIFILSLFVFLPSMNGLITYSVEPYEVNILSIYKSISNELPETHISKSTSKVQELLFGENIGVTGIAFDVFDREQMNKLYQSLLKEENLGEENKTRIENIYDTYLEFLKSLNIDPDNTKIKENVEKFGKFFEKAYKIYYKTGSLNTFTDTINAPLIQPPLRPGVTRIPTVKKKQKVIGVVP